MKGSPTLNMYVYLYTHLFSFLDTVKFTECDPIFWIPQCGFLIPHHHYLKQMT